MNNFLLSAIILLLCLSCSQNKSTQGETKAPIIDVEVTPHATTVDVEENPKATIIDVIRNYNKYKDVKRLFEGFDDITYSPDTLTVFNFEKGTIVVR